MLDTKISNDDYLRFNFGTKFIGDKQLFINSLPKLKDVIELYHNNFPIGYFRVIRLTKNTIYLHKFTSSSWETGHQITFALEQWTYRLYLGYRESVNPDWE